MNQRIEKLKDKLPPLGGCYITSRHNVRYFSGFTGEGSLVIMQKHCLLMTDFRYVTQAKQTAPDFLICDRREGLQTLRESGIAELLFEGENVCYLDYARLQEELPNIELTAADDMLNAMRMVKDEKELMCIATASEIAQEALTRLLPMLRPGTTERQAAAEFDYTIRKLGASGPSFETIVASGPNSAMPHAVVSDREMQAGDLVTIDCGCIYEGYCSDMTRTFAIGHVSARQKEIYALVLRAQREALRRIGAGAVCSQIDAASRSIIDAAGYGKQFGHALGHGVGLQIHEEPRLSARCDLALCDNMVVTVEPGVYLANDFGVRIEDLVVVKGENVQNLVQFEKELMIL